MLRLYPLALVAASAFVSAYVLFYRDAPPRISMTSMAIVMNMGFIFWSAWLLHQSSTLQYRSRIAVLMIAIYSATMILLFAVAFKSTGLMIDGQRELLPKAEDCLYFSIVTWTTVGYGDIAPFGLGRVFASIEALLAYFVMAFLIAGILRVWENK